MVNIPTFDNSEDEFIYYYERMNELFPNLKFSPNEKDYNKLNDVLVQAKTAIVYHDYTCYCWDYENFQSHHKELFIIQRDHNITYNDFYTECEKMWKHQPCNHNFLEIIEVDENNVITMWFGS